MKRSVAWHEREFNKRWRDLTDYNSERTRGLVHTPSWQQRMARKQALYDEISQRGGDAIWTCDVKGVYNV